MKEASSVTSVKLLDLLVCSTCGRKLTPKESSSRLVCEHCRVSYPIENGIPILLPEGEISAHESRMRDSYNEYAAQAAENEYHYWWYMARRRILISLLRLYSPVEMGNAENSRISAVAIDLGCGTGALGKAMRENLNMRVFGLDLSFGELQYAHTRNSLPVICTTVERMPFIENAFDVVVMADLIEHLDDDLLALQKAFSILKPGGIALITVPAYEWLRHPLFDSSHKRRYTRATLIRLSKKAGFVTLTCSYMNSILFPLMMIQRLATRRFVAKKEGKHTLVPPNALINRTLYFLFVLESWALRILRFPYGGSVFCIAMKS